MKTQIIKMTDNIIISCIVYKILCNCNTKAMLTNSELIILSNQV